MNTLASKNPVDFYVALGDDLNRLLQQYGAHYMSGYDHYRPLLIFSVLSETVSDKHRPIKNPVAQHETRFFDFAVDFDQINFQLIWSNNLIFCFSLQIQDENWDLRLTGS